MQKNVLAYDLLISRPSDVIRYVDMLENEEIRFNNVFGKSNGIVVRTRHWTKDSYSEFGDSPQELLNKQIVDSSDMVLGIFWTRFGEPTENYGSGTKEEIERMLKAGKQVFLFFLEKPTINPHEFDPDQFKKIQEFKNRHRNDGIYFSVSDENDLTKKIRNNLELYFYSKITGERKKQHEKRSSVGG